MARVRYMFLQYCTKLIFLSFTNYKDQKKVGDTLLTDQVVFLFDSKYPHIFIWTRPSQPNTTVLHFLIRWAIWVFCQIGSTTQMYQNVEIFARRRSEAGIEIRQIEIFAMHCSLYWVHFCQARWDSWDPQVAQQAGNVKATFQEVT